MCRIYANGGKAEVREVAENGGHKTPSRTGIVLGHGCCERCESGWVLTRVKLQRRLCLGKGMDVTDWKVTGSH